jgi:hypothetical protein
MEKLAMRKILFTFGLFCLPVTAAGCSNDESPLVSEAGTPDATSTGGSGGSSGDGAAGKSTGGAGGTAADGGNGVVVSGLVVDFDTSDAKKNFDATKYPPLSGVEVCVYEDSSIPCVKTGADGKYSLHGVPAGVSLYLSYNKTDYSPNLYGITATAGQNVDAPAILLTTLAFSEAWAKKGGTTYDPKYGTILFGATTLGPSNTPFKQFFGTTELFYLDGFSVAVSPAVKSGPVFTSAAWAPDPALKTASAAGWGYIQAAPGTYTLTITHPTMTCGTATTKVVAGYWTTYVGTLCSPKGDAGGPVDAGRD